MKRRRISSLFAQPARPEASHLYVIDLARGLAAFAILFYHYQAFYYVNVSARMSPADAPSQPFYAWLYPLYEDGHYAVQFFWLISGFVFAAVYVSRRVTTRSFVVNRLARLYPLHLLTLCIVAVLQAISFRMTGAFQIYPCNDAYHFVLQLFFASFWGLQKGPSFNHPIWSVSLEVLVYGLFWVTLPFLFRRGLLGPVALAALGWLMAFQFPGHMPLLRQCVFYFFAGTVAYLIFNHWRGRPAILFAIAAVLMTATAAIPIPSIPFYDSVTIPLLCLSVIFACCWLEALSVGDHIHRARWVGDSTYGIYLWHIPIQIVALVALEKFDPARSVIRQPWWLFGFLVIVVTVARVSFLYFERPMRTWLRRYAGPRKSPEAEPGSSSSPEQAELGSGHSTNGLPG